MAITSVDQYNTNPDLNTDIDGINIAEECPARGINNAIRTLMSQIAAWRPLLATVDFVNGAISTAVANLTTLINGKVSKGGDTMSGDLTIQHSGNTSLTLDSVGAVIAKLQAQSDGNIVLYRNAGGGDVPIWGIPSDTGPFWFNVPVSVNGNLLWHAGNFSPSTKANVSGQTFSGSFGRDASFYFDFLIGNPIINFAPNCFLQFDRTDKKLSLIIDGITVWSIDSGGTERLRGQLIASTAP